MRITKKLIAKTCLPIYKELLKNGKKDSEKKYIKRLEIKNADEGICHLFHSITQNRNIYNFVPLTKLFKCNSNGSRSEFYPGKWIYKAPYQCSTKKEMIDCINKRVQLLESWL